MTTARQVDESMLAEDAAGLSTERTPSHLGQQGFVLTFLRRETHLIEQESHVAALNPDELGAGSSKCGR